MDRINVHMIARHKNKIRLLVDEPNQPKEKCGYSDWGIDEVEEAIKSKSLNILNPIGIGEQILPDWELEPTKLCALSIIVEIKSSKKILRYADTSGSVYEDEINDTLLNNLKSFWNMEISSDKGISAGCKSGPLMMRQAFKNDTYSIIINGRAMRLYSDDPMIAFQIDRDYEDSLAVRIEMACDPDTNMGKVKYEPKSNVYSVLVKVARELDSLCDEPSRDATNIERLALCKDGLAEIKESEGCMGSILLLSKIGKEIPVDTMNEIRPNIKIKGNKLIQEVTSWGAKNTYTFEVYDMGSEVLLPLGLIDKPYSRNIIVILNISAIGSDKKIDGAYGVILGSDIEYSRQHILKWMIPSSPDRGKAAIRLLEKHPIEVYMEGDIRIGNIETIEAGIYGNYELGDVGREISTLIRSSILYTYIWYSPDIKRAYFYNHYSQSIIAFKVKEVDCREIGINHSKNFGYLMILDTIYPLNYWTHDRELHNLVYNKLIQG